MRKIVCDLSRSPREIVCDLCDYQVYCPSLCAWLSAHLLCRGFLFEREELGTPGCNYNPQWRSLCGRSCVDIVKILLCKGGDVEQWLESRNISLCLRLIHCLLLLSLLYLALLLYCSYSYARYSLCVPTLVLNQESF